MSTVKVDTISERTVDNGVAVDGVTIKDSGLSIPSGGEIDIASGGTLDVNGTADFTGATVNGLTESPFVKVSDTTITSYQSQIDFTDVFTADYNIYLITFSNIGVASSGQGIKVTYGNSGLTSNATIGWTGQHNAVGAGPFETGNPSASNHELMASHGNGDTIAACGQLWVHYPFDSSTATKMTWHMVGYDHANYNTYSFTIGGAQATSKGQQVSFRLEANSGNLGSAGTGTDMNVSILGIS